MEKLKVVKLDADDLEFDNGVILSSEHDQDCCESHYLSFADLTLEDFEGLEFDLTGDTFFRKVEDYGIELIPILGYPVRVPGYGHNNGYYSTELTLVISKGREFNKEFDISECQVISG